jgi:hypothetical protein
MKLTKEERKELRSILAVLEQGAEALKTGPVIDMFWITEQLSKEMDAAGNGLAHFLVTH